MSIAGVESRLCAVSKYVNLIAEEQVSLLLELYEEDAHKSKHKVSSESQLTHATTSYLATH